jgi:hypothetical protein
MPCKTRPVARTCPWRHSGINISDCDDDDDDKEEEWLFNTFQFLTHSAERAL